MTLLREKGSPGKGRVGRVAQRNHGATKDPVATLAALLFYKWGDEGLGSYN